MYGEVPCILPPASLGISILQNWSKISLKSSLSGNWHCCNAQGIIQISPAIHAHVYMHLYICGRVFVSPYAILSRAWLHGTTTTISMLNCTVITRTPSCYPFIATSSPSVLISGQRLIDHRCSLQPRAFFCGRELLVSGSEGKEGTTANSGHCQAPG